MPMNPIRHPGDVAHRCLWGVVRLSALSCLLAMVWPAMAAAQGITVTPPPAPPVAGSLEEAREIAEQQQLRPYRPANELERDVQRAALLDAELRALGVLMSRDRDPAARARGQEIADALDELQARYEHRTDLPASFMYQYYVLGGRLSSASVDNLLGPVREAYEANYAERDRIGAIRVRAISGDTEAQRELEQIEHQQRLDEAQAQEREARAQARRENRRNWLIGAGLVGALILFFGVSGSRI